MSIREGQNPLKEPVGQLLCLQPAQQQLPQRTPPHVLRGAGFQEALEVLKAQRGLLLYGDERPLHLTVPGGEDRLEDVIRQTLLLDPSPEQLPEGALADARVRSVLNEPLELHRAELLEREPRPGR